MIVQCPHCKKDVPWTKEYPFRPFCSERCKIIDLGAWAIGSYKIPSSETLKEEDFEEDESSSKSNSNQDDESEK